MPSGIGEVHPTSQHRDRHAASPQSPTMCSAVNPIRRTGNHRDADIRQPVRELGGNMLAIPAGRPRPHDRHGLLDHLRQVKRGSPVSPVTGTNWEGVGVAPDVGASSQAALEVAVGLASKAAPSHMRK